MKSRALQAIAIAFFFCALPSFAAGDDGAMVLCYHIVESPQDPRMEISREAFRQQMRYLAMTGYNVIPLREAYEYAIGKRASLPPRAVVVTIDDGWRSTYTEVWPEMKKWHFPFTVFIYPRIIGQTTHAMTWAQVKAMSDAGVDIESHSFSHPFLTQRRHTGMAPKEYTAWIEHELAGSKKTLEHETGKTVQFIAYPYGDYDHYLVANVARSGYLAALTCDFGFVRHGSDPLRMKRFAIDKRLDFAAFRRYLGANPMRVAAMTPPPGQAIDPGIPVTISAKIPNYKTLDPKSIGLALMSTTASVPYSYDPKDGLITLTIKDALKGFQRALVWATDLKSGRRFEASWTFRIPEPPPAVPAANPLTSPQQCPPADPTTAAPVTAGGSHLDAVRGSGKP